MASPKDTLKNDDSTAYAVFLAARKLLGDGFQAWEPESIWLELLDQGVDLSEVNRDKLLAVTTLISTGAFYWDATVFENTTMAFNHEWSSPDIIQEASPAQMAWAVCEAELILHREGKEAGVFDHEPAAYAAVSLHRDGFIVAPESLEFAQDALDTLRRGHNELKDEILSKWKALDKNDLDNLELAESPIDVQLGKLAAVFYYLATRLLQFKTEVDSLG